MSNVSFTDHGHDAPPHPFSVHLSGIVNGNTHVAASAGEAVAVAVAATSTVSMPKNDAIIVEIGFDRALVRYTVT